MATNINDAIAKEQYDAEHPQEHDKTLDLVHKTREVWKREKETTTQREKREKR